MNKKSSNLSTSNLSTLEPSVRPISVLLVDDNYDFRQGLQSLLNFFGSTGDLKFQVIGRAASVEQALELAEQQSPELILLDLELGEEDGIQFLHRHQALQKRNRILVVSGHDGDDWIFQAMRSGARGFLPKHHLSSQLLEAIETVMRDEIYLPSKILTGFMRSFHFHEGRSLQQKNVAIHLTDRERDVLHCVVHGASNEEIADKLNITVGTVKAYLTAIFEKLNVRSRTQAALKALKMGLIVD
jgi:DNA-binding NarL/FixJ family response regulator